MVHEVIIMAVAVFVPALGLILFLARRPGGRAKLTEEGIQELEIVVQGRYWPNVVVVKEGIPVRLKFTRREGIACSDRVIFSDFNVRRKLAPFCTTPIEFVPGKAGEFLFTCAMGMYQGRLVVEKNSKNNGPAERWDTARLSALWENKSPRLEAKLGKVPGSNDETGDHGPPW